MHKIEESKGIDEPNVFLGIVFLDLNMYIN